MSWSHRLLSIWQNKHIPRKLYFYLFLLPSFIGTVIFVLLPYGDVVRRSFLTVISKKWNGIANYLMVFENQAFQLAVKNTIRFIVICIPLLLLIGFCLAWFLCQTKGMQWIKSIYLLPMAMPTATIVLVWKLVFYPQGFLNKLVEGHVDYLGTSAAFWVLVASYIWKNLGYTVVLWMAGIFSIPKELHEAAAVDGTNVLQELWYVILPQLKGSFFTIIVISFLNSFKIYREAYLVAGSYPDKSMYLLQHLFNNWFINLEFDKMAAASVCVGAVLLVFIFLLLRLWRKE